MHGLFPDREEPQTRNAGRTYTVRTVKNQYWKQPLESGYETRIIPILLLVYSLSEKLVAFVGNVGEGGGGGLALQKIVNLIILLIK